MSDDIIDALESLNEDDDGDAHDVTDALGEDEEYWKSRNQAKKAKEASKEDED